MQYYLVIHVTDSKARFSFSFSFFYQQWNFTFMQVRILLSFTVNTLLIHILLMYTCMNQMFHVYKKKSLYNEGSQVMTDNLFVIYIFFSFSDDDCLLNDKILSNRASILFLQRLYSRKSQIGNKLSNENTNSTM